MGQGNIAMHTNWYSEVAFHELLRYEACSVQYCVKVVHIYISNKVEIFSKLIS